MSLLMNHLAEFGQYVFDKAEGRLRRDGKTVDLPPRAVAVLCYLLEHRDHIVSREELKSELWRDVHIAANSIHKQVSDLRLALGAAEDGSAFIETYYKRGWQFVAEVREPGTEERVASAICEPVEIEVKERSARFGKPLVFAVLLCCAFIAVSVLLASKDRAPEEQFQQLTHDGRGKDGPLLTDGKRIYFIEKVAGLEHVASVPISGGEVSVLPLPIPARQLQDISPDGRSLMVQTITPDGPALWTVPIHGGKAQQLMDVYGIAKWSPDGRTLVFAGNKSNTLVFRDAARLQAPPRATASVAGEIHSIGWRPDGRKLRLTVVDPSSETSSIWELDADGKNAQKLDLFSRGNKLVLNGWWNTDGSIFFYQAGDYSQQDLFAVREAQGLFSFRKPQSVALTNGIGTWDVPAALPDGSRLAAIQRDYRSDLVSFDSAAATWKAIWDEAPAYEIDYSRDSNWVTFTHQPDHTIWKGRADGSERVQLTSASIEGHQPHWSPDGQRIAFMGKTASGKWRVHVVPEAGGNAEVLLESGPDQGVPTWSADGRFIVFGDRLGQAPGPAMSIHRLDVATRAMTSMEGAKGLWTPRVSPNGKTIAALTCDSKAIRVRKWAGTEWAEVVRMNYIDNLMWSADSKHLYFNGTAQPQENKIYRLELASGSLELLADLNNFVASHENWFGVTPDGKLLGAQGVFSSEIWALKYRLPN